VKIDPRDTSRRCGKCGHTEKNNRKTQSVFLCKKCGYTANADYNGAGNIRLKGLELLGTGVSTTPTRTPRLCNPPALAGGS
jgi:transposase